MPEEKLKESYEEDKPEKPQKKARSFLNKVVIRKLPPNLNSETFIEMISPLPDYSDLYFCPADWTLGAEATSRAYIEFKKEEDIFIFKDKFDGYIFVDPSRGSDYPAIVEYAAFQGLPKSRARKKDKNVGTIEECDHFMNFLEQLKKEEEEEGTTTKNEVTYSYQLKDDKKITSTPLIEFLAAKNQEKRDAKRKKVDDKRKQRDEDKQKKKIQVAKKIPEPIKEAKEEVFGDGITVRTVPSRLGRNERKKDKETKTEPKAEKELTEKDLERREKRDKANLEHDNRRKKNRDEKRKLQRDERDQKKAKDREQQKETAAASGEVEKREIEKSKESVKETAKESTSKEVPVNKEKPANKEAPAKSETKRYSALRKARQEKSSDVKESTEPKQDDATKSEKPKKESTDAPKVEEKPKREEDPAKKEARLKRAQEQRERRAREADERAQRHIKNKDRPTLQIYQPKRRQDDGKGENFKSSDEYSETSRKRSDNEHKSERREKRNDRKPSRKNSRDESGRKKNSRKNSDEGDKTPEVKNDAVVVEKLEKLKLEEPPESPKAEKAEKVAEAPKVEVQD